MPAIIADELVDDSKNDTPVVGLKGSLRLRDRFTYRLSCLTGAEVTVPESNDSHEINVYMTLPPSSLKSVVEATGKFAKDLQAELRHIARLTDGKSFERLLAFS